MPERAPERAQPVSLPELELDPLRGARGQTIERSTWLTVTLSGAVRPTTTMGASIRCKRNHSRGCHRAPVFIAHLLVVGVALAGLHHHDPHTPRAALSLGRGGNDGGDALYGRVRGKTRHILSTKKGRRRVCGAGMRGSVAPMSQSREPRWCQ